MFPYPISFLKSETGLDPAAFVTEWTVGAGDTIKLPSYHGGHSGFTLDYNVDWGDLNSDSNVTTDDKTHTYIDAGTYQVVITNQFGSLNMKRASATERGYLRKMVQWGTDNVWSSLYRMFYGCTNMLYEATDFPNLTNLVESTDAREMFWDCSSITSLNISNWANTSNITRLSNFFYGMNNCTSLNASGLDLSSVTRFESGLNNVGSAVVGGCAIDLSNIMWGANTNLTSTFYNTDASSLDLSGWDFTGNPNVNVSAIFRNLDFNASLDLSSWVNFSASNFRGAFRNSDITSVNITGWSTSSCTDYYAMFKDASDLEQVIGLNELSSASVTGNGLANMFSSSANISFTGAANNFSTAWGLGLGNCTGVEYMFNYAGRNRVSPGDPPNVGNWVLSGVTSFIGMFDHTYFSSAPDIVDWDVSSATTFSSFMKNSNFTVDYAYDLSNWNFTNSLTSVREMFRQCNNQISGTGLTSLEFDSANCDFGNVTDFYTFAYLCYSLTSLKFTGATDFSSATNFSNFTQQAALTNLDLGTVQDFSSSANNWAAFGNYWTGGIASVNFLTTANIPATTGLSNMFQSSQVATADYDKLLQALVNVGNSNGNLHGGNSTYTAAGAGGTARAALVTAGWTITDGGGV